MLVLSRKRNESVVIGGSSSFESLLKVTVIEVNRGMVKLGIEAPEDIPVHRWEVWKRICADGPLRGAAPSPAAPLV